MKNNRLALFAAVALASASVLAVNRVKISGDDAEYTTLDAALKVAATKTDPVIWILESPSLSSAVTITNNTTICAYPETLVDLTDANLKIEGKGAFTVASGGKLVFTNLTVTAKARTTPLVTAAEGSSVVLQNGFALSGPMLSGTAACGFSVASGAVLAMESGAAVSGCVKTAATYGTAKGGAVRLAEGAVFDFAGGSITGCSILGHGGAVYAASGSTLNVSGDATAAGNSVDDIYLEEGASLTVTGALTGAAGCLGVTAAGASADGDGFATLADGVSADDTTLAAFANGADATAAAKVDESDASLLVWSVTPEEDEPTGPQPVDEADAAVKLENGDGTLFYASLEDGFAAATNGTATLTVLGDVLFTNSVTLATDMTIACETNRFTVARPGSAMIDVGANSLTVTNVTFSGGTGRLVTVTGGTLTLDADSEICYVYGSGSDFVAPVTVWGGTFKMNGNASIYYCRNAFSRTAGDALAAGGAVVDGDGAKAILNGGRICGCVATGLSAGGLYIGNTATIEIAGGLCMITDNTVDGVACNLVVQDLSALSLTGDLEGDGVNTPVIGFTEGIKASTEVFGEIASGVDPASASYFVRDANEARGLVGDDGVSLVWGESPWREPSAIAFASITETDEGWELVVTNRVQYCNYRLLWTEDLAKGFTSTGAWEQATADGAWTTNIVTTAEAMFFRAEGEEGRKPDEE